MYLIVFLVILVLACIEVFHAKINVKLFNFAYLILILLTVLRKGQGSDYYNYQEIYKEISIYTEQSVLSILLMKDPGFSLLNYLAQQCGISYVWFSAICSFAIMALLYPFFAKVCQKSLVPLFLFYSTFYLIYCFSALRQGLALAILLGFAYPFLKGHQNIKCILSIIVASLFHQSALICLLFLIVYKLRMNKRILSIIVLVFSFYMLLGINFMEWIPISSIVNRVSYYIGENSSASVGAIALRILVILPIFLISNKEYEINSELRGVRNILVTGYVVYSIFSYSDLVSSRLTEYFRVFEGLFLFLLLYHTKLKKINIQLFACFSILALFLYVKDINSFIHEGQYENCNVLTYPYLTVFDDDDTVMYYRKNLGYADRIE